MSPVLLDHRNLKWVLTCIALFVFMTFCGGYIFGFERSNGQWMAKIDPVEITLPEVVMTSMAEVEEQTPEFEEPGANIDVDSADEQVRIDGPFIKTPLVTVADTDVIEPAVLDSDPEETGLNEVADQVAEIEEAMTEIVDNASEEDARYSIQVGMYKKIDNAANRVEELLSENLNAYIHEYNNANDETRYNVRFAYFSSFSSAGEALKIYQQHYTGSGYIARIKR